MSKLPPIVTGTSGATRRMFSMIRSKVPWPPRSGRMRSCVSRSPSSVTFTPVNPSGTMHSTTSGVSSRPLVMMLTDCMTPRDAACFEDRPAISNIAGTFSSGSPPKNVSTSRRGFTSSTCFAIQAATCAAVSIDIRSAGRPDSPCSPW